MKAIARANGDPVRDDFAVETVQLHAWPKPVVAVDSAPRGRTLRMTTPATFCCPSLGENGTDPSAVNVG